MSIITVNVLLFASAREAAGNISSTSIELKEDDADTSNFRKVMAEKFPSLSSLILDEDSITLALNEEYISSGQVFQLKSGDTLALIPPISGG